MYVPHSCRRERYLLLNVVVLVDVDFGRLVLVISKRTTTMAANIGDNGHPCDDPSSMWRIFHSPSTHLWNTLPGLL